MVKCVKVLVLLCLAISTTLANYDEVPDANGDICVYGDAVSMHGYNLLLNKFCIEGFLYYRDAHTGQITQVFVDGGKGVFGAKSSMPKSCDCAKKGK